MFPCINSVFEKIAGDLYPQCPVTVSFKPLFDLSTGDVGSDVCHQVAKAARVSPDQVAGQFVSHIPSSFPAQAKVVEGYINLRIPQSFGQFWGQEEKSVCPEFARHIIYVPAPKHFRSAFGFMRAFASALVQSWLLRVSAASVKLVVGRDSASWEMPAASVKLEHLAQESIPLLRASLKTSGGTDFETAIGELISEGNDVASAAVTLWCWPALAWSNPFRNWNSEIRRNSLWSQVKSVDRAWLEEGGEPLDITALADRGPEFLARLALYLAGPQPAADIDLGSLFRPYKAEPLQYLRQSIERFERVCRPELPVPGPSALKEYRLSGWERDTTIRVKLLRALMAHAGESARVSEFLPVFMELPDRLNLILNKPDIRSRLSSCCLCPHEIKLLTSVGQAMSDMVKLF